MPNLQRLSARLNIVGYVYLSTTTQNMMRSSIRIYSHWLQCGVYNTVSVAEMTLWLLLTNHQQHLLMDSQTPA